MLCTAALAILSTSCSSADPQIMQTDVRVIASLDPETETIDRRLQVSVDVYDPDGAEDMDLLRVELTRYRLSWENTVERLDRSATTGQNWYTANDFSLPIDGPIGTVRLSVEDKSQRQAMTEFVVPPLGDITSPELYPNIVVDAESVTPSPRIRVPRGASVVYLLVLEADGRLGDPLELSIDGLEPGTEVVIPPSARERVEGRSFYLLVERSRTLWLETGPWSLQES